MKLTSTVCDLCHRQPPSLYCPSDAAFLCSGCDSDVHTANFLVARHIRLSLSSLCKSFHHSSSCTCTSRDSSSSSTTIPEMTPPMITTVGSDRKTRDVLVTWCTRLGVDSSRVIIEVACRHCCEATSPSVVRPYRVALAASLWLGLLRFTNKDDEKSRIRVRTLLKRLEKVSGVPAKLIVAAAGMLIKDRRGHQHVAESSAEC